MTSVPLRDLRARIRPVEWEQGEVIDTLFFACPFCGACEHAIPHRPTRGKTRTGRLVWQHVSGEDVDDLTLAPSYLAVGHCRLHALVRGGVLQILPDSRGPRGERL